MKSAQAKLIAVVFLALCFAPQAFGDAPKKDSEKPQTNNPQFHKKLLDIAAKYKSYGKVDDMAKWAPWLCAAPPPPKARLSDSKDSDTHGRKLYYLFAANRNEYVAKKAPQVGQTIVKESWVPQAGMENNTGVLPKLSHQSDLFIMTKLDPATKDTDEGWIYGTVTPDGKTVTSSGKVESCMKCHIQAKNDRLFGLKENLPVIGN